MTTTQCACSWAAFGSMALLTQGHCDEQWQFESAGIRAGTSATRIEQHFVQAAVFTGIGTPWTAKISYNWQLRTTIDVSAGVLQREGELGFICSGGPIFTLSRKRFPIQFAAGISPTLLSRYEFGDANFGIPFQFTSHGGFNFVLSRHWLATYRYQHMSNASLSRHNPGLDLHSLSLAYHF